MEQLPPAQVPGQRWRVGMCTCTNPARHRALIVTDSHASYHSCLAPHQALQLFHLWVNGTQGNCTPIENTYFLSAVQINEF